MEEFDRMLARRSEDFRLDPRMTKYCADDIRRVGVRLDLYISQGLRFDFYLIEFCCIVSCFSFLFLIAINLRSTNAPGVLQTV